MNEILLRLGCQKNVGGYFLREHYTIAFYANPFHSGSPFLVIYHEYIHYLVSKSPHKFPRWYNEGLATMFETFESTDGIQWFGKADRGRWRYMAQQAKWIPMDTFISDQTDYYHNDRETHAHSQAWALCIIFFTGIIRRTSTSLDGTLLC